jgi:hypothetical protein
MCIVAKIFYLDKSYEKYYLNKQISVYIGLFNKEGNLERIIKIDSKKNDGNLVQNALKDDNLQKILSGLMGDYVSNKYSKGSIEGCVTEDVEEIDYLGHSGGAQILGMYVPSKDKAYVLRHLSPMVKQYVKEHELEHRRRHYAGESQDESLVDATVEKKLGYGLGRAA